MVLKKALLFFFLIGGPLLIQAQQYIDLAKFSYATSSSSAFDSSAGSTSLQEMNGNLSLPIVINDSAAFLTGVIYENLSASFSPGRKRESITTITLKLGVNVKHNAQWSGTYMFLPQIASDLENVGSRDYQYGGVVLMKYTKSANFNYRFGLYGNSDRFGPFFVPIFGFYYLSLNEKFEANVFLPLTLDFNYSLSTKFRLGTNFKGQVKSYNLNNPITFENDLYLTKSAKDLYAYMQYEMGSGFHVQLGVGRSIGRHYRMYDEQMSFGLPLISFGDDRNQLNEDFEDSWLVKASVFYRLKLD